jgi:hypothetical protein
VGRKEKREKRVKLQAGEQKEGRKKTERKRTCKKMRNAEVYRNAG